MEYSLWGSFMDDSNARWREENEEYAGPELQMEYLGV